MTEAVLRPRLIQEISGKYLLPALWTVNGIVVVITVAAFLYADVGVDWGIYIEAGHRYFAGGLYEWAGLPYRYSPVAAPLFSILAPIGYAGWSLLHFAVLFLLPRKIALLALLSAPFWNDVYNGNTMTFVFVAAYSAMSGSRWGAYAFAALTLLMPRPVMLPVLGWLLWKSRRFILPFAAMLMTHSVAVAATGWGPEWIAHLIETGPRDIYAGHDLGPSQWIGLWWYPLGLAVAVWLTWRGRVGLASVAVLPYWLPHYWMMGLLDAGRLWGTQTNHQSAGPASELSAVSSTDAQYSLAKGDDLIRSNHAQPRP